MDSSIERMLLLEKVKPFAEEYNIEMTTFELDYWFYQTDALKNYTFVFPFEAAVNRPNFVLGSKAVWLTSVLVSILYIFTVFAGQKLMENREPFELRLPLILWNLSITIFSIMGFFRLSQELFHVLSDHGFVHSVCMATYLNDPVAAFWIIAFLYSKFMELGDTAFLILRKKKIIFLHWYHHAIVLVFSWQAAKDCTGAGRWYAWTNYLAHSFTYAYLTATSMKYRPPKWAGMLLISIEITQMIIGIYVQYTVYGAKNSKIECHQSWATFYFAVIIYLSFFILFCKYFYDHYLKRTSGCNGTQEKME